MVTNDIVVSALGFHGDPATELLGLTRAPVHPSLDPVAGYPTLQVRDPPPNK